MIGQRMRVHYNLHRGDFSVTDPSIGRVVANVTDITLTDVTFRVQPSGLRRIRERGTREVCAYVVGIVATVNTGPAVTGMRRVTFNPHRADTFTTDGQPIHAADRITFANAYGWR